MRFPVPNINSGDALCVALITTGLAFPLLALLKKIIPLGCLGHLVLAALIGSSVIVVFSPSLTDASFIPASLHEYWPHTTNSLNAFIVTTIFSAALGVSSALGASSLAFCGLVISGHTNGVWASYLILSISGTCIGCLTRSLLEKLSPWTVHPIYIRYSVAALIGIGLSAIYVALPQYEGLVATDFKIAALPVIAAVGSAFSLVVFAKQCVSSRPKTLPPTGIKSTASHKGQNSLIAPTQSHSRQTHSHTSVQHLQEMEDRYRALVEVCPDAIIIHAHSTVLFANSAATKLLGRPDQQSLFDTRLCEFIPSDHRERFSRYVQNAMGGAHIPRIEERILPFHGSPIDVEMCGRPVTFNGVRAIQTLIRDISPRRRAEEALHEHRKQWHTLLNNMSEAIMVLDIDNARIETANPNAQSLFGCPTDQAPPSHKIASLLCKMAHNAEGGRIRGPKILPRADGGRISSDICITRFNSYGRQKALVFVREPVPLSKPPSLKPSISPPWEKAPKDHPIAPQQHRRYPYIRKSLSSQGRTAPSPVNCKKRSSRSDSSVLRSRIVNPEL